MGEEGRAGGGTDIGIRLSAAGDEAAIRQVVVAAFGREDEADLIDRLRTDGDIAALFVAEYGREMTGVAVLARLDAPFPAVALAPLAVAPLWQGQGIGRALLRHVAARGDAVFVLGDAAYYAGSGFSVDRAAGYVCAYAGPAFMVLGPPDLPATGRILYPQAFSGL